jgi:hypothetical protein
MPIYSRHKVRQRKGRELRSESRSTQGCPGVKARIAHDAAAQDVILNHGKTSGPAPDNGVRNSGTGEEQCWGVS